MPSPLSLQDTRREAMGLLARAMVDEIRSPLQRHWPDLPARDLRAPEIGLVMVRGRMGGDGAPFNVGEVTVTRAVVELPDGRRGHGQRLGRHPELARLAALADALWLDDTQRPVVEREILAPIRCRLAKERTRTACETAATRVDFFTLLRGDPES
jgi:alpha-D-ribose 1-methylphosphonate 5-triphosphate synthase subunit PhnG